MVAIRFIIGGILYFVFIFLGLKFADVDLAISIPGLIVHRSAITHSALIPFIFYIITDKESLIRKGIAMGFLIGTSIHLAFDLFPSSWRGFALIYFPILGRISFLGYIISPLWIVINICFLIYMLVKLGEDNGFLHLTNLIIFIGAFIFYSKTEKTFWGPLIAIIIVLTIFGMANNETEET